MLCAADNARFCQMESKRGIAPPGGAYFRVLARAGWGNAIYHLMLCDEFDAAEAHRIGLVQEVVPAGTQVERVMDSEDAREGIQSFIERRKAVFKGR